MYDLVIIGAGPAGSTLARELPRNLRTAIIDKRTLKGDRPEFHRSCGGLLSPDAQEQLAVMNQVLPSSLLVDPQIFSVRSVDLATGRSQHYSRHYLNMDRRRFELWLRSLVPVTVDKCYGWQVFEIREEPNNYHLKLRNGWEERTLETRYLVGADGPGSLVRKTFFPEGQSCPKYISIQETFTAEYSQKEFGVYFHQEITDYYAWTIPKGKEILFGAAFPLSGSEKSSSPWINYRTLRETLQSERILPGQARNKEGSFILRPRLRQHILSSKDRAALIGEAGGWISPSSAEGFSYAFKTARLLAEACFDRPEDPLKAYSRAANSLRRELLSKNLKSRVMYNQTLRNLIFATGIGSIKKKTSGGYPSLKLNKGWVF